MPKQNLVGSRVSGIGQFLLAIIAVIWMVDIIGFRSQGLEFLTLSNYLAGIFTGVILQFAGAAIANMKFTTSKTLTKRPN